jgi:protein involved in polysaccharide export with SLBB domain
MLINENQRLLAGCFFLVAIVPGCTSYQPQASVLPGPVRSGECLLIQFTNRPVPEMREIVDANGDISLPYYGKLRVSGLTLQEVREVILTAYQTVERPLEVSVSRCP